MSPPRCLLVFVTCFGSGEGRPEVQTGLRVDGFVFDGFKELYRGERLMVGEAVQRLMGACLKGGSVTLVLRSEALVDAGQRKADELKLKGALAELRGFIRAVERDRRYVTVKEREVLTGLFIVRLMKRLWLCFRRLGMRS